ncbi:SIT4 phosphatase-associated protein domain-containing protein [Ditylenchus destructor]|uniref:SIT4 phosphatase-associated protein domain-containing protein n=1 Tax=Ditylenchus destructor TaxID=166010 RepID=A0AAD4NGU9_9BILA|nr:SIT4 phosphatase-associated protein domain-containing protein [Ditylenchus destructor]
MSFWNTIGLEYLVEERQLEKKLNDPDVNLSTILEDMHCFQEIRNSNETLLNYLKSEKVFRELFDTVLRPKPLEDDTFRKDSYKFVHQCTEAICLATREFFKELVKYEDLVRMLVDFLELQSGQLNHLTVTFYSKLIMSFLNAETEAFLILLEESNFLENCLSNLEFGVMFELICSIGNCSPDPAIKERIKKWYTNKRIADTLLNLLTTDQPSEIHENAAAIWGELIKASREIQYNVEITADPMLDALQNAECLERLLDHMFPDDANFCPSIVANGCLIFNTLLETNYIRNSPSWIISQEQLGHYNSTPDQALSTSIEEGFPLDAHRVVETICAERSSSIVKAVLKCLDQPPDAFYGDAFMGCMQLLVNLVNTNFGPTHLELLKTFSSEETHLDKLFHAVAENSKRSVFNTQLTNLVLYILYSSTGSQKQLMDFLIRDFNLPRVIRDAVDSSDFEDKSDPLLERVAKRSFFLNLANRLIQCQNFAEYVDTSIKELPDYDEWIQFNKKSVQAFIDQNKSDKVLPSTTRSSSNIEIDEIKDIPFCMDASNDDFRASRLDVSPSTNLATLCTSVDEVHSNVVQIAGDETWPGHNGKTDFPTERNFSFDDDEEAISLDSSNGSPTRKLFEALTSERVSSFGDIEAGTNEHHASKVASDADQCTTSKAAEETGIHDDEV